MKTTLWNQAFVLVLAAGLLVTPMASAQTDSAEDDEAIEEEIVGETIVVLGSRASEPRSVKESPVPVDVIPAEDLTALGNEADLTDNLKTLIPSYTATPATGDGSAFIRPTSLRGTAPDQVLVLVNGKRRHRTALVHIFAPAAGNGAHGVDIGMIPSIAVKRVEVLRDGASSQYGSDAIAGVINFEMKDDSAGGEVQVQFGEFYDGENSVKAAVNAGFPLPNNGFFNISLEAFDNDGLSRGIQRPDAQALIDAGVPGVGSDAVFGDEPLVQSWGRPASEGMRLFVNAGTLIGDSSQWYLHANYGDTDGRYRFFYRPPDHSSLAPLREQGFTGLPAGYTPFLDGDQTDLAVVTGLTGLIGEDMVYDVSVGLGSNELDYFLNNSINPDIGLVNGQPAQRDFDVGALEQEELNLNVDFTKPIRDDMNLAFGFEWREETFSLIAGEPSSYAGAGVSGFRGFSPNNSGDFSRDNVAAYVDVEHDVSDEWLLQYALRYEDFSDFGGTLNWKVASRYSVSDAVALRGAVSTGFHAPTPGQANYQQTITTFDSSTGLQTEEGLVPSTDPRVAEVGGTELTEETSLSFSAGFTADIGDRTTLTLDTYLIEIDDRIYRTGDIPVPGTDNITVSFYTNALDIESQGIDLVLDSGFDWGRSGVWTDWSLVLGYNELDVVGQTPVGGVNPVSDATIEDIENNYPNERFVLNSNTAFNDRFSLLARLNYYGKHYDERGRIGADVAPSFEIGATSYFDVEFNYQITESLGLAFGAINVFDEFVDEIGEPFSNRLSVGLQYPRRSAANYEGGSLYLRAKYRWK